MYKNIIAIISFTLFLFSFVLVKDTIAIDKERNELPIDTRISDQQANQYADPNSIWIYNIKSSHDDYDADPEYWYSMLYYYSITRLGYADIPFNYLVDRNGNLYEGREGGAGTMAEVDGTQGGVLIGYMSSTSDVTPQAASTMAKLISEISYTYGIKRDNVYAVKAKMISNDNLTTKSTLSKSTDEFSNNVSSVKKSATYSDVDHITYKTDITNVTYNKSVKAGEKLSVEVEFKNKNTFPWFTDKDPIYISTANYKDSPYAVNGVWPSFSKAVALSGKTILPDETVKVTFDLQGLLLPSSPNLSFVVMKAPKVPFENGTFPVTFKIEKGDYELVQVKETPSGYLNVRSCGGPGCEVIGRVNDGQMLIMLEKSSGWYKIKYDEKKSGWIYGPYVKEL